MATPPVESAGSAAAAAATANTKHVASRPLFQKAAGLVLSHQGKYSLEQFAKVWNTRTRILTHYSEFRAGRQRTEANRRIVGWQVQDATRIDMQPMLRHDPEQFRELQTESLRVPIAEQLKASSMAGPAILKDSVFSHARADWLKVPPPDPTKPDEQIVVPLEPNGAGSAAYEGWSELKNNKIQDTAHECGERLIPLGTGVRAIVLTSGESVLPEDPQKLEALIAKSPGDAYAVQELGRQAPTKFSHEKVFGIVSALTAPLARHHGESNIRRIPFVPKLDPFSGVQSKDNDTVNFEDNHLEAWKDPTKPAVMAMQMDDGIRCNEDFEIRIPPGQDPAKGGALHFKGEKVNMVYNDGGLAQILAAIEVRTGQPARIDTTQTMIVNDTLPMAEDKFQYLCLYNDFMKIYGKQYPVAVQQVAAFHCKGDIDSMAAAAQRVLDEGADCMPKAGTSRWGMGMKPIPKDSTPEQVRAICEESKNEIDSTINKSGVGVAGRTYCMMQAYERAKATFPEGDKRHALNGAFVEFGVDTIGDYDPKYKYLPAGMKLKSSVDIAKVTFETTANLSAGKSKIPPYLRTVPMHAEGMQATGLTPKQCEQLAKLNTHLWAFYLANKDVYAEVTRTSAFDPPPRPLTRYPGP